MSKSLYAFGAVALNVQAVFLHNIVAIIRQRILVFFGRIEPG
jgi:hypothetical protein